jgi:hypothetical protein
MSMKWMRCLNHNLQQDTSESPSDSPTATLRREAKYISDWGCIHMTARHSRLCWKTLYDGEVDLLWVWSVYGASIIIYSKIQVRNQKNHLLPLRLWDPAYIRLTLKSLWPLATKYDTDALYICIKCICDEYEVDGVASIITYSKIQVRTRENHLLSLRLWDPAYIRLAFASLSPLAGVEGTETLYMYKVDLLWVWSG